jgi:hypothetical protein
VTALRRSRLGADESALLEAIDSLVDDRLLARSGGQLVTLAVFRGRDPAHPTGGIHSDDLAVEAPASRALLRVGRSSGRER